MTLQHGDLVAHPGTPGDLGTVVEEDGALCVIWHECLQRPWPDEGGCHVDAVTRDGVWEYSRDTPTILRPIWQNEAVRLARVARAKAALRATMAACEPVPAAPDIARRLARKARRKAERAWLALEGVRP